VFNFYYLGILRLAILLFRTFDRMAHLWKYGARIFNPAFLSSISLSAGLGVTG
jgi:hypothetical protein